MERFEQIRQQVDVVLHDTSKPWESFFSQLESKTGLPRNYLFFGGITFFALYITFGYGAQLVTNLVGLVYPAYASIHAIETSTKIDDTKWLIYWVTFACINTAEYFSNMLVSWIPLYWIVKCGFLVWCMLPMENNGSKVIYNGFIRPYFLKYTAAKNQ